MKVFRILLISLNFLSIQNRFHLVRGSLILPGSTHHTFLKFPELKLLGHYYRLRRLEYVNTQTLF